MKTANKVGSLFLRCILLRMKELGVSQTELAKRMQASRPYVVKVLQNAPEKLVSEGSRASRRLSARATRSDRKGPRDVNIALGSAVRFAKALQIDFFPDLRDEQGNPYTAPDPAIAVSK